MSLYCCLNNLRASFDAAAFANWAARIRLNLIMIITKLESKTVSFSL